MGKREESRTEEDIFSEGDEPSFPTKKKGDDTSDEEKEWLEALEKGTLDDSGMLKRSRDPKLMTARQRALIHGQQAALLQLPSATDKHLTIVRVKESRDSSSVFNKRTVSAILKPENELYSSQL